MIKIWDSSSQGARFNPVAVSVTLSQLGPSTPVLMGPVPEHPQGTEVIQQTKGASPASQVAPLGVRMPRKGLDCCWLNNWDDGQRAPARSPRMRSLTSGDFVDVDVKTQHGRAQHEGHPRPDDCHRVQDACRGERAEAGSAPCGGTTGDRRCLEEGPGWTRAHRICLQCSSLFSHR